MKMFGVWMFGDRADVWRVWMFGDIVDVDE